MSDKTDWLQLRAVTIIRRELQLVRNLSLELRPGQVLGVSGPSGCGKTTLLRCLSGMSHNYEGQILRPHGRISMVFQEPRLLPWRHALKNVQLPIMKRDPKSEHHAYEWLVRVGLDDASYLYPAQMSGGMRQRVAIARAMAVDPQILLVDEPFAALDEALSVELRAVLSGIIRESGVIAIWVSHDPRELDAVSDLHLRMGGPPGHWRVEKGQRGEHNVAK